MTLCVNMKKAVFDVADLYNPPSPNINPIIIPETSGVTLVIFLINLFNLIPTVDPT